MERENQTREERKGGGEKRPDGATPTLSFTRKFARPRRRERGPLGQRCTRAEGENSKEEATIRKLHDKNWSCNARGRLHLRETFGRKSWVKPRHAKKCRRKKRGSPAFPGEFNKM